MLKLQYFGHLMQRADSLEKTLMLGKIEGRRRRGRQRMRWLDGINRLNGHEFEQAPGVGDGQGSLACCSPRGYKESDTTEQLNWRGHREKQPSTCPGDRPQEEQNLLAPWPWTLHLQDCGTIHFCCVSCPVSGPLLWWPEHMNIEIFLDYWRKRTISKNPLFGQARWDLKKELSTSKDSESRSSTRPFWGNDLRKWSDQMKIESEKCGVGSAFCLQCIALHLSGWWWNDCEL